MVHAESNGVMSSPYSGGMASPYSDHSSTGVPSPPTVVSEYNRAIDVVNTDGPHLVVVEEPQSKFRFRYKSEMVGTHGQIKAERAERNKAVFPTVKLMNWTEGPAVIRLALFTGEDNFNHRRRHVHELSGKNCDKDTGMCEMVADLKNEYTTSFQNLGIIHIAKRDVKEIIKQRKKNEKIDLVRSRQPHRTLDEIRQSITPTDLKKIEEEAYEVAKNMDLNKVVLRFQAFYFDTSANCYKPLTRPVDSAPVVNLKNASTGELKIVRMSECSAPCTGGTEVWMLVEKVRRTNIKIRFYELDSEGREVWSAYGEFSEADVHHQYAIIFRTPPYRTTNLRSSVRVKVQLERPNDNDVSEARDFTYYPGSHKRQSPFMEFAKLEEDEDYHFGGGGRTKRRCQGPDKPLDLTNISNGNHPNDGTMVFNDPYNQSIMKEESGDYSTNIVYSAHTSPQYTVPSPNHPGASPNSNSNSSGFYQNSIPMSNSQMEPVFLPTPINDVPQIQVMVGDNPPYIIPSTTAMERESSVSPNYQLSTSPNISSPLYQAHSPQQALYQQTPSPASYQGSSPAYQQQVLSPQQFGGTLNDQMVPRSPNQQARQNDTVLNAGFEQQQTIMNQQLQQQQQQRQQMIMMQQIPQHQTLQQFNGQQRQQLQNQQMNMSLSQVQESAFDPTTDSEFWNFNNLTQSPDNTGQADIDLSDSISLDNINPDLLFGLSDLQTDCVKEKKSRKTSSESKKNGSLIKPSEKEGETSVDDITQSLGDVKIGEDEKLMNALGSMKSLKMSALGQKVVPGSVDVAFLVAISAAESLQAYAATNDLGRLLATHRYLLAVQNNQGDNALHTAVSNNNWDAFNKILTAALNLRPKEMLNTQNYAGETPLHLAVRVGELAMTDRLVSCPGIDVSLTNRHGDTPLHLAAALTSDRSAADVMARLLTRPANGTRSTVDAALHTFNYQGETALHVAVINNNVTVVRQMVAAGADVHLCERKRGANSLHLAAQHHCHEIADFLMKRTTMTVNSRMFDDNTALHIAAQEGDAMMCSILIEADADPKAKNSLKIHKAKEEKDDEEDETEEETEEEEDETEEEPDCYTPLDYAAQYPQVLQVLEGKSNIVASESVPARDTALDSGIDVNELSSASVV